MTKRSYNMGRFTNICGLDGVYRLKGFQFARMRNNFKSTTSNNFVVLVVILVVCKCEISRPCISKNRHSLKIWTFVKKYNTTGISATLGSRMGMFSVLTEPRLLIHLYTSVAKCIKISTRVIGRTRKVTNIVQFSSVIRFCLLKSSTILV